MSDIANPNWLTITGYLYLAIALGLILKSQLRPAGAHHVPDRARQDAQRHVDAMTAAPFLFIGMCAIVASQLATMALTPSVVVLILSAPVALLLYLGYEGLWVDTLAEPDAPLSQPRHQILSLPKPRPELVQNEATPLDVSHAEALVGADSAREHISRS